MELRTSERPEPSHIHVPRPSRAGGRQTQVIETNLDELCALLGPQAEPSSPAGLD
jgi:hypothetical protein